VTQRTSVAARVTAERRAGSVVDQRHEPCWPELAGHGEVAAEGDIRCEVRLAEVVAADDVWTYNAISIGATELDASIHTHDGAVLDQIGVVREVSFPSTVRECRFRKPPGAVTFEPPQGAEMGSRRIPHAGGPPPPREPP
jgi:hypothetical protein